MLSYLGVFSHLRSCLSFLKSRYVILRGGFLTLALAFVFQQSALWSPAITSNEVETLAHSNKRMMGQLRLLERAISENCKLFFLWLKKTVRSSAHRPETIIMLCSGVFPPHPRRDPHHLHDVNTVARQKLLIAVTTSSGPWLRQKTLHIQLFSSTCSLNPHT